MLFVRHHYGLLLAGLLLSFNVLAQSTPATVTTEAAQQSGIEITVNINTASADELATLLVGIGNKKAQQIVDYRAANGPFKQAEDLLQVKGIGQSILDKNRPRILL